MKIRMSQLRKIIRETIANLKREDAVIPGGNSGNGAGFVRGDDLERLANRGDTSIVLSDELIDDEEEDDG